MTKSRKLLGVSGDADCQTCMTVMGIVYAPLVLMLGAAAFLAMVLTGIEVVYETGMIGARDGAAISARHTL